MMNPAPLDDPATYSRTLEILERLVDVGFRDTYVVALVRVSDEAREDLHFVTEVLARHRAATGGDLSEVLEAMNRVQRVFRAAWGA